MILAESQRVKRKESVAGVACSFYCPSAASVKVEGDAAHGKRVQRAEAAVGCP